MPRLLLLSGSRVAVVRCDEGDALPRAARAPRSDHRRCRGCPRRLALPALRAAVRRARTARRPGDDRCRSSRPPVPRRRSRPPPRGARRRRRRTGAGGDSQRASDDSRRGRSGAPARAAPARNAPAAVPGPHFRGTVAVHDCESEALGPRRRVRRSSRTTSCLETDLILIVSAAENVLHGGPAALVAACDAATARQANRRLAARAVARTRLGSWRSPSSSTRPAGAAACSASRCPRPPPPGRASPRLPARPEHRGAARRLTLTAAAQRTARFDAAIAPGRSCPRGRSRRCPCRAALGRPR